MGHFQQKLIEILAPHLHPADPVEAPEVAPPAEWSLDDVGD
ncbi:MAG TPA: hypothetical protein VKB80_14870 [Kofleriaceae bacterium]|nr:hypothetical protein [Kofleriaceae bacterium]